MTVRYTTETGYPDREDMVVINNIEFDTDNVNFDICNASQRRFTVYSSDI